MERRSIMLIITQRCNLSCVYCYEHNKTSAQMSFATAKAILDKELVDEDTRYSIDLFGGEPLQNFPLIQKIYDYLIHFPNQKIRNNTLIFATTNGTLINDENKQWFRDRKDKVILGLSLDGTRTAHNLNRNNSFDLIDLDFFLKTYPKQKVKMTVSELSLPHMAESIVFLQEKGFVVTANLAYMIDWSNKGISNILEEQLSKLIEYYLEHPNVHRIKMLDFDIASLSYPKEKDDVFYKYCGAGTGLVCYDVDGKAYPCQLFSKFVAGDKAIPLEEFKYGKKISKVSLCDKCRDCYYQRICSSCMGSNYLSTNNCFIPDENRCILYKKMFKACAKLKALEWEKGILKLDKSEEQALLRSIAQIQKEEG